MEIKNMVGLGILILLVGVILIALIVVRSEDINDHNIKESEEVIKIGALLALSGDAAFYGQDELKAINMAIDEANSNVNKWNIRNR